MLAVKATGEYVGEHVVNCAVQLHEDKILKAMREIWEYDARDCEAEPKRSSLYKLVDNWLDFRMRQNYKRISSKIFDLEREVVIDLRKYSRDAPDEKVTIKIPVFCVSENCHWSHEHKFTRPDTTSSYNRTIEYKITLSSERRPMPDEIRKAYSQAQAHVHRLYAEALTTYPINEIIFGHPNMLKKPSEAKLVTLWQPKASDLRIDIKTKKIDRDPVLVLQYNGWNYLVTTWNEPKELPFDEIVNKALENGQATIDNIVSE